MGIFRNVETQYFVSPDRKSQHRYQPKYSETQSIVSLQNGNAEIQLFTLSKYCPLNL